MVFSLPVKYERSVKQIEHKSLNLKPELRYITWWYGGVLANRNPANVPLVSVWFRQLNPDGSLGVLAVERITLSALRQFQIGSIWHKKTSTESLELVAKNFKVRFSVEQWETALSVDSHYKKTGLKLIPERNYELRYPSSDFSKILVFESASGRLLIPCLEFLARCYGHSEEINRILVNNRWGNVVDYFDLDAPVSSRQGAWSIKLPYFAKISDSHLLAHLRYDEFTWRQARRIQSDLDKQLFGSPQSQGPIASAHGPRKAHPTIGPWFEGDAEMEVEGIPLENGDFLGLRITGYSVPGKPSIHCEIDTVESPEQEDGGGGRQWPIFNPVNLPEGQTTPTTDLQAPGGGSHAVIIKDTSISILGIPAPISVLRKTREGRGGRRVPPPEDAEISAPGDRSGSDKGIGRAYFTSQAVLDSDGAIQDLWNGLLHLKDTYPSVITAVNWFSFAEGLCGAGGEPLKLISLMFNPADGEDSGLSPAAEKWVRFDAKIADKIRCALVVLVTTPGKSVCLFEVQRKHILTRKNDEEEPTPKEQSYCGLVLEAPQGDMRDWLPPVLFQIAEQRGIMSKVLPQLPNMSGQDYRRSFSKSDAVVGESTARLALKKMAIDLPRPDTRNGDTGPD